MRVLQLQAPRLANRNHRSHPIPAINASRGFSDSPIALNRRTVGVLLAGYANGQPGMIAELIVAGSIGL
jgi:hypothetical protein